MMVPSVLGVAVVPREANVVVSDVISFSGHRVI